MDAIADDLDIQVGQNDITERLVLMSRQYGIEPQQLIQLLQQNNQLPAMFADVRRGLTVAAVVEAATVTDTDGNVIDTTEFFGSPERRRGCWPRHWPLTPPRPMRPMPMSMMTKTPKSTTTMRTPMTRTPTASDAAPARRSDAVSESARPGECASPRVG